MFEDDGPKGLDENVPPLGMPPGITGAPSITPSEPAPGAAPAGGPQPEPQHPPKPASAFGKLGKKKGDSFELSDQIAQDERRISSFQRAKLSMPQKLTLFFVVATVLTIFIAVGVWLYVSLNSSTGTDSTTAEDGNENVNSTEEVINTIPSHERDTDEDGLLDIDEPKYGTDVNVADTDGDGFTDGDEVAGGYNPIGPGLLDE